MNRECPLYTAIKAFRYRDWSVAMMKTMMSLSYLNIIHTYNTRLVTEHTEGTAIKKISSEDEPLGVATELMDRLTLLHRRVSEQQASVSRRWYRIIPDRNFPVRGRRYEVVVLQDDLIDRTVVVSQEEGRENFLQRRRTSGGRLCQ